MSPTQAFGAPNEVGVGHFAAVIRVGPVQLAITTDGVGTKILVAELAGRYYSIGIDCVAMNVNDLICVGATPLAMLDYIACAQADPDVFSEIGRGLAEGARQAGVSIVGGETAQVPDLLRGLAPSKGLDLVGMAVGVVPDGSLLDGSAIEPGDPVIALASSGVHSNGLSLARSALFAEFGLDEYLEELGCTLADELLKPTQIYVPQVQALAEAGIRPRAIAHVSGDGLLNLRRVEAPVGFELTDLPEPPGIFSLIERTGRGGTRRDANGLQHGGGARGGGRGARLREGARGDPGHRPRRVARGPGRRGSRATGQDSGRRTRRSLEAVRLRPVIRLGIEASG